MVRVDPTDWRDPFREMLGTMASANSSIKPFVRTQRPSLETKEVEQAVLSGGFSKVDRSESRIHLSMDERRLMWRVPAVLDSFFDVQALGLDTASKLVQEGFEKVRGNATKDRVLIYWSFTL